MARIRTIKPEFFCSQQVADCSTTSRLLFVGLWCFVDDQGVHPWKPRQIKMQVFPGDDFTADQIQGWLEELHQAELIGDFEADGCRYLYVTGWHHQKIEKPRYQYPAPPNSTTSRRPVDDQSTTSRRQVGSLPDPTRPDPTRPPPTPNAKKNGLRPGGGGKISFPGAEDWNAAFSQLAATGYKRCSDLIEEAHGLGVNPDELLAIVREYQANKSLFEGPGAIADRVRNGTWPVEGVQTAEAKDKSQQQRDKARATVQVEGLRRKLIREGCPAARDWSHKEILEHVRMANDASVSIPNGVGR